MRSVCRVVEASRWSPDAVKDIVGTPSKLCPLGDEDISPEIENSVLPHADLDSEDEAAAEGKVDAGEDSQNAKPVPITDRNLRKYEFLQSVMISKEVEDILQKVKPLRRMSFTYLRCLEEN